MAVTLLKVSPLCHATALNSISVFNAESIRFTWKLTGAAVWYCYLLLQTVM